MDIGLLPWCGEELTSLSGPFRQLDLTRAMGRSGSSLDGGRRYSWRKRRGGGAKRRVALEGEGDRGSQWFMLVLVLFGPWISPRRAEQLNLEASSWDLNLSAKEHPPKKTNSSKAA